MNKENIFLFDTVVSKITTLGQNYIDKFIVTNDFFISQFNYNKINQTNDFKTKISNLPSDLLDIKEYSEKQNELTSCDLNIFRIFGVGETMHSYLLANLLNPYAEHGQKHLFLNEFLDLLNIKRYNDSENWIVTAEKGRIDVLLKRVQPHSVVVIENKSNYASDQENQLYRYWYQEIYNTICKKHLPSEYLLNPPEHFYQLIYLSPAHWKIPSNNSQSKPLDWDDNLPKEVPLKTKHLLFSKFIVKWLNNSLEKLPKENHRIKEHIKQYLEFWT